MVSILMEFRQSPVRDIVKYDFLFPSGSIPICEPEMGINLFVIIYIDIITLA